MDKKTKEKESLWKKILTLVLLIQQLEEELE